MPWQRPNRRRFLQGVSGGVALAIAASPLRALRALADDESADLELDAYALLDSGQATLHLTVSTTDGAPPPSTLDQVLVKVSDANGTIKGVTTYHNVAAPGGAASIGLGQQQLMDAVSVEALAQTGDPSRTAVVTATTSVTEFALRARQVLVPDHQGYGGQFNGHLYTAFNDPTRGFVGNEPPADVGNCELKIEALRPGLSRVFLEPTAFQPGGENRLESFIKTVELAQRAGATLNVTWWYLSGSAANDPATQQPFMELDMQNLADTLVDLIQNRGLTTVQQITIQNEVNSSRWTPEQYEQYYRLLDSKLRSAGIRDRIKFVGGDLVYKNQADWLNYMAEHMGDVLDGWSVHMYWNYGSSCTLGSGGTTSYMIQRLNDVRAIYESIPADQRKPISITEFGVRGLKYSPCDAQHPVMDSDPYRGGALTPTLAGYYQDGAGNLTPIAQTNVCAFQHAWFNILSANLGYAGTSKWDLFRAQYDFSYQDFATIGYLFEPQPGEDRWPLRPTYHALWLMARSTGAGWQVLDHAGASGNKLIAAFRGPSGELTFFALSSDEWAASFTIGDLPPQTTFHLVVWNGDGGGTLKDGGALDSGPTGSVLVQAPAQSFVCLTTKPLNLADVPGGSPR